MNRKLAIGVAISIALTSGAWWVGRRSQTPAQAAARAKEPPASWITAKVERRVLTKTVIVRGDVQAQSTISVSAPLSASVSAILTKLPPSIGSKVSNGEVIAEVSGRPIIVLLGSVPVFRQMEGGTKGVDIRQLQSALRTLGYPVLVSGEFDAVTKDAVKRLYRKHGYSTVNSTTKASDVATAYSRLQTARTTFQSAETDFAKVKAGQSSGKLLAAQAVFNQATRALADAKATRTESVAVANASLRAAQAADQAVLLNSSSTQSDRDASALAVLQAQNTLNAAIRSGDNAVSTASEQLELASDALDSVKAVSGLPAAQSALADAKSALEIAQTDYDSSSLSFGPTIPIGEIVFVPVLPATIQNRINQLGPIEANNSQGDTLSSTPSGIVTLTSGGQQVVAQLSRDNRAVVALGDDVQILNEETQAAYKATVTSMASDPVADSSGQLTYRTVVTPLSPLPTSMTGQNVRLTFGSSSRANPQLIVPITAVSISGSGRTRVSLLRAGMDQPIDIFVNAGTTSDGFVAITPAIANSLRDGDTVVIGR
jgi:hypothetical protein